MNIKELIAILKEYPNDYRVEMYNEEDGTITLEREHITIEKWAGIMTFSTDENK